MRYNKSGMFIVAEGNEGAGKSFFLAEVTSWAKRENKRLFSLLDFCAHEHRLPHPEEFQGYDALLSQEPSPAWIGHAIREEMVTLSERLYTGRQMGHAWSLDRLVLYRRVVHPALEAGIIVFSDRSIASSIVYQPIRKPDPMPIEELLSLEGQQLAFKTKIDHMAIYLVDPNESLTRLKTRAKQDNAVFDKRDFISLVDKRYRSDWFRDLFEKRGTTIEIIDTTGTVPEDTRQRTRQWLDSILAPRS